jgi:proteic killer suppression protein
MATAVKVMARLLDLQAAARLADMRRLPGHCHELDRDRAGQLGIDVGSGVRIVFVPTNDPGPRKDDGGLDWSGVDAVQVIEVVNYHEG